MAPAPWQSGFVVWLVVLSATVGFLLVENGQLRERLQPVTQGRIVLLEAHLDVTLDAAGRSFNAVGARLVPASRFDGTFIPASNSDMPGTGGCVWLRITQRLPDAAWNLTRERLACGGGPDPVVAVDDGMGGRWVVLWRSDTQADVWGDARHLAVEVGAEAGTNVTGTTTIALTGAGGDVQYGPWPFQGTLRFVQHGGVPWRLPQA